MTENDAGQGLDFEVLDALALLLREIAHLGLRESDVLDVALGDLGDGALDVMRAQFEIGGRPVVEFFRQVLHRFVLARVDIGENALDRLAHLRIRRLDHARVYATFEIASHRSLLSLSRYRAQRSTKLCAADPGPRSF